MIFLGKPWVFHIYVVYPRVCRRITTYPRCSMYGVFTYIYPKNSPNVGKYSIHGASGYIILYLLFSIAFVTPVARFVSKNPHAVQCSENSLFYPNKKIYGWLFFTMSTCPPFVVFICLVVWKCLEYVLFSPLVNRCQ